MPMLPSDISVIIPTLNEGGCLATTIENVRRQLPREILVVDGGSSDETCQVGAAADRLLHSSPGRALQMNHGAAHARGEILLFLHADCTLEDGALAQAAKVLRTPTIAAGCFRMQVQAQGLLYRSIDFCATSRVRMTGIAYGDQGLFLQRTLFESLGGFPTMQLMEDLFFSRMLRDQGRVVVAGKRVYVSARRWQRNGLIRQTLRNWYLTALAWGGIHPNRLASYYPEVR